MASRCGTGGHLRQRPSGLAFLRVWGYSSWRTIARPRGGVTGSAGVEEVMVTAVRQFAAPVSLVILIVFLSGPGLGWADPRPDPGATHAVAGPPSEAALAPDAAPPRRLADLAGIPADLTRDSEDRAVGQSPQWFDADTSPAGGS